MTSVTQPVIKQPRHNSDDRSVAEWLNALTGGKCDQPQFLRGVGELVRNSPDSGWELLGLIDQYFRRGKLSAQTFATLKTHLQGLMVGRGNSDAVSAPPQMQGETSLPPTRLRSPAVSNPPALETRARQRPSMPSGPASATPDPAPRTLAVGDVLRDRYLVQGLVGQGGMGTVYAAVDQFRLDRSAADQKVALKVLHTEVIKRPRLFAELRREFQHLQSLSHPNIVRVHEFDRDGDLAFFTMEYLSGALLSRVLSADESSALPRPYGLAIIRDVGSALAHAHARGVVHGDLNPGNIFVTDNGEIRVLDFGASNELRRGPWISEFDDQKPLAVATRGYASCQVLEGETPDARDDVYALACIAYVLLAGANPFGDESSLQARTLRMTPARPRGLTRRQWQALRAGLQFDRDSRPSDVAEWLDRLDLRDAAAHLPELLSLRTVRQRRRRNIRPAWVLAAGLALLAGAGGWWAFQDTDWAPQLAATWATVVRSVSDRSAASIEWVKSLANSKSSVVVEAPDPSTSSDATLLPDESEPTGSAPPPSLGGRDAGATPARPATPPPAPVTALPRGTVPATAVPAPRIAAPATAPLAPRITAPTTAAPAPRIAAPTTAATASQFAVPATAAASPSPAAAPVDAGGTVAGGPHARLDLAADNVEVAPDAAMAQVTVKRSRSLRGDVSFSWWTESGTAKPGRDFMPVKTQVEHLDNGQSAVSLVIPVVADTARRTARNFYVVIDQPSDNASLGTHTLTMVTLPGSEPEQESPPDH